jgi:2-polyprenyl-3-methyl-5-hydroxy-6-metoxy-1,4-benzoquinol methylase
MGNFDQSKKLWEDEADERKRYGKGFHWVESPVVAEYMNRRISGDPNLNWVQYSVDRYLRASRSPRILSLGCGGGALERGLLQLKPDALIVAIDFSPGAVALARQRAEEADLKIDYRVADLNDVVLEPKTFDFVFASAALHHVARLEHVLTQVRASLTPGGPLIAIEYIGPNHLQWTSRQIQAINEILALLPDRYKRRISSPDDYKREFIGPSSLDAMKLLDPTEGVRSEDILPLTRQMLRMVEFKPFGGTLLHMLLQDIVGNFNPADEADNCVLRLICHIEWQLIAAGVLTSDFGYFVAKSVPASD